MLIQLNKRYMLLFFVIKQLLKKLQSILDERISLHIFPYLNPLISGYGLDITRLHQRYKKTMFIVPNFEEF